MSVVANVAINVDSRNAVSQLRQVETRAQATEKAFGALQQAVAAFGAGFALSKVIADVKELDTNLRRLGTVGGDVNALDKGLGQLSKNLGGVANKAELAAASYQALSAGFTDTAGNIKVVEAATKAAVGGLADTTQVTAVLTKTLNAYNMTGSQAIQVTDSISKAIEYGQVEWSDYTSQLGRVASVAAVAGVSLDEVNAFVAAATKNGATAEVAFTGLGSTLATILKPSKESADAAAALGINWTLAGIQGEGFESLMGKLAVAMQKNPELATQMVGGQEAVRGAFAAAAKGGKDYQAALESIGGAAGKTDKDFQAMKASLVNQLKALDTAFKNLSEALGRVFGPELVKSVTDVTGAINGLADAISAIPAPIAKLIGETVKVIAIYVALQKAIQAVIALRAGYIAAMTGMAATTAATGTAATASSSAFALYTANTRTLQAAAATATPTIAGLGGVLRSLAAIGSIAIAVNIAVYGLQALMQARAELDRLRGARQAGGAAAAFGGSAPATSKDAARKTLAAIETERKKNLPMQAIGQISGFGRGLGNTREQILAERERFARGVLALPTRQTTGGGGGGGGSGAGGGLSGGGGKDKTKKERESQIPALQNELALQNRILEIVTDTGLARLAGNKATEAALQIEQVLEERSAKIADINLEKIPDAEKELKIKIATAEADRQLVEASFARQNAAQDLRVEQQKQIADALSGLDMELLKVQAKTDIEKQAIQFLEIENQLKAQGITLSNADKEAIRGKIAEIQKLTKEQEAANAKLQMEKDLFESISNTVAGAFSGAIDAAVKGTENLGDALKGLAVDLLATIGKMMIMYGIAQALGAAGGSDGIGVFSSLAKSFGFKGAKDGAYWPGGFEAFAQGGVVTSPTMGLIGEGGEPEYVIPQSKMSAAMSRYSRGARGESVIPGSGTSAQGSGAATATMEPIDVRYSVERINNVEYVTADQFRAGMAQAAQQGAIQGERRAMRTLTNSAAARGKLGI